jgi:hypothetical protein
MNEWWRYSPEQSDKADRQTQKPMQKPMIVAIDRRFVVLAAVVVITGIAVGTLFNGIYSMRPMGNSYCSWQFNRWTGTLYSCCHDECEIVHMKESN